MWVLVMTGPNCLNEKLNNISTLFVCFVWVDDLRPSQQFFSHVGKFS